MQELTTQPPGSNPMKRSLRFALVMLASLSALPMTLTAAEKVKIEKLTVKTLPPETYALLEKGNRLSLVWKGKAFVPSQGFKLGEIAWKADVRQSEVSTNLKPRVLEVAKPGGFYTLDLAITDAMAGAVGFISHTDGTFVLEGRVKDPDGNVVAAFVTKEKEEQAGMAFSFLPGIDRIVSGINSELFR